MFFRQWRDPLDADALFIRGKEAADRGNYEYAITIFRDVLRFNPSHRNSRIALRGCEMEQYRERGAKAKVTAITKGIGPLIKMHLTKNPEKVAVLCEDYLVNDPNSVHVLARLAGALRAQGHLDAAIDTLEFARQRNVGNAGVLRDLAEYLFEQGQYDKAIRWMAEVVGLKPNDRDSSDRLRRMTAEAHLKRSRMEDSQSYRETLKDEGQTKALEQEGRVARSESDQENEVDRLKRDVAGHPEDPAIHAKLGDSLMSFGRFVEAEAAFRKAFEIGRKYPAREKMGTARLRHLEQIERELFEKAEEGGRDPVLLGRAGEARRKRLEFAVKEFEFRRKQHPTDLPLAWQLGQYYMETGGEENIQKAIQQFQQAMNSASLHLRAQMMLGRCFAADTKTLDMAKEQFTQALNAVEDKNTSLGKSLMYELGETSEKLGENAEALNWYKKIFSVDAAFKDVGKKIKLLG
jgi:tetratricopeptide (TPR) repeat protein